MAKQAKAHGGKKASKDFADRGTSKARDYRIEEAGIHVSAAKPQTSAAKSEGSFGKQGLSLVRMGRSLHLSCGERLATT